MTTQRYYIVVDNLAKARGSVGELSYTGESPDDFAAELQRALRSPGLFQQWKALQPDPDAIDDSLGQSDASATVSAKTDRRALRRHRDHVAAAFDPETSPVAAHRPTLDAARRHPRLIRSVSCIFPHR